MDAKTMQAFCSTDENRYHIQRPVSRGAFTYATNGHVMVRVPRLSDVAEDPDAPNFEVVIGKFDQATRLAPLSGILPKPVLIECTDCDEGDTLHDCPSCTCVCETCGGKREYEPRSSVAIATVPFDLKYVRQVAALPGIRFQIHPAKSSASYFEFEGGTGCLMPLRETYPKHLGELSELAKSQP